MGYLHRGYEKMAESMSYIEYIPHTDRLDYTATLCNNVEKLAGIEAPKRAQFIRMIVAELARIAAHMVAIGTYAMDVGAVTMVMWTFRERERIQEIFDRIAGARFTTSYTRIGGLSRDMPNGWLEKLRYFPTGVNPSEVEVDRYTDELRETMYRKDIPYVEDMLEMAQLEGVQFLACKTSADLFDLGQADFIEGVEITLAGDFMKRAAGSGLHLVF